MISNEDIKQIVDYFSRQGQSVRVRDIAFTLLATQFEEPETAYQCLFGKEGYEGYARDEMRVQMEAKLREMGLMSRRVSSDDLTFEENRREMQTLLKETQMQMDRGLIEPKDGLKIMADIRVKLNDKFKVQEERKDRLIVVEVKYNDVCRCGREIYIPTKEDLMKKYNLVESEKTS